MATIHTQRQPLDHFVLCPSIPCFIIQKDPQRLQGRGLMHSPSPVPVLWASSYHKRTVIFQELMCPVTVAWSHSKEFPFNPKLTIDSLWRPLVFVTHAICPGHGWILRSVSDPLPSPNTGQLIAFCFRRPQPWGNTGAWSLQSLGSPPHAALSSDTSCHLPPFSPSFPLSSLEQPFHDQ